MIKKLVISVLALSLATSTFYSLPASADEEKDDKAEEKAKTIEIKVTGYMADDWLAEHDEFDITFEHDGEKTYGFLIRTMSLNAG